MDQKEFEADYKRRILKIHRDSYHTALDDMRPFDTSEYSKAFLSLKDKFQHCPSRFAPLCADSDRELTELLRKCKSVNEEIREKCLGELEEHGLAPFQKCTMLKTRIAQVEMHDALNRLMRRQKRTEEDVGI